MIKRFFNSLFKTPKFVASIVAIALAVLAALPDYIESELGDSSRIMVFFYLSIGLVIAIDWLYRAAYLKIVLVSPYRKKLQTSVISSFQLVFGAIAYAIFVASMRWFAATDRFTSSRSGTVIMLAGLMVALSMAVSPIIKKPFVFAGLWALLAGGVLLTMVLYCEGKISLIELSFQTGTIIGFAVVAICSVLVFILNKIMYRYNFEPLG